MTDKSIQYFMTDRPVGLDEDTLWQDDPIREQISRIAATVAAPLFDKERASSESITFAVYGRWGMGKSSALRMIRDQAEQIAEEEGVEERLKFCHYVAPSYEALQEAMAYNVRMTMAMRILAALAGSSDDAIAWYWQQARVTGEQREELLPPGRPTESEDTLTAHVLQQVAASLGELVDFDRIVGRFLSGAETGETNVLVVFVDDLDRCETEFVWQVLNTIQQWSDVPNLFFVLAIDQEQLRKAIEGRSGGISNPDFALEKYVQHALWVPDMDERRLVRFVSEMRRRRGVGDPVLQAIEENVSLLQFGLRVLTPRSVKRCLNTIRLDLENSLAQAPPDEWPKVVKRRLLEYVWPNFYRDYFLRAIEQEEWGRYHRAFTALEAICSEFFMSGDEEELRFQLRRISASFAVEWIEIDPDLARYLGLEPYWFIHERRREEAGIQDLLFGPIAPPEPERSDTGTGQFPPLSVADLDEEFLRVYLQSEAAEAAGNRSEALQHAEAVYRLVAGNRGYFLARTEYAPMIGNAAITAERFKATELATRLYRLALEVDPEHSNNIQNYVDFIVRAPVPDLYDEAKAYIEKLKTGKHAQHRPERTAGLEAQLGTATGEKPEIDRETVEKLIADFADDPTDTRKFVSTMMFLDQIGDFDAMRRVARMYYDVATTDSDRYTALRGLADMLAASPDERNEREAMDMYRRILESEIGECSEAITNMADMLHNYATLLYKHDYDDEAGRMWYESYRLKPQNQPIRRAYGLYLLRAGRPDLGKLVGEGEPVDEMALQPHQKEIPERFLDEEDVDRWWEE